MNYIIRLMQVEDLPAVNRIQAEAYAGYFLESTEVIAERFTTNSTSAWIAECEGRVCAYLVACWSVLGKINTLDMPFDSIENTHCLYLHDLAVEFDAQGYGLGEALFCVAEKFAKSHKANALALVSVQNSKKLWQLFGFTEFKELCCEQQKNVNTYSSENAVATYMTKNI